MYYFATLYLWLLGMVALFYNFTEWRFRWKSVLLILAVLFFIYSMSYQQTEKRKEGIRQENLYAQSEMTADFHAKDIKQKIDDSKEKEKQGSFQVSDYLNRLCWYFEELNLSIRNRDNLLKEQFLTSYFAQTKQIPDFYTWGEWRETENVLFKHMLEELQGHFVARGTYGGGRSKDLESEFVKEREKYIKAKEREFKNR